jgi:hypothetical protein
LNRLFKRILLYLMPAIAAISGHAFDVDDPPVIESGMFHV